MSIGGPPAPTFSPIYSIGASSISPSPITTVPSMATVSNALAHGLDRGAVGLVLLAEADPARGGERRGLGDAHEFQREVAVGDFAGLWRVVHGTFLRAVGLQGE